MTNLFIEFDLMGADKKIAISCTAIATIVYSGEDRTEIRLITGGVHIVKGTYEEITNQFHQLN